MTIDEIELKICYGDLTASQVFTQMKQHVIDDSNLEFIGSLWKVDHVPSNSNSVKTTSGLYLNQVLITEKERIVDDEWTDTKDKEPTVKNILYWVLFPDGSVRMHFFNEYKKLGGHANYWQGMDDTEISMRNTKYIEITKPAPPQEGI